MPSGSGRTTEDHEFKLIDNRHTLELIVIWPELMIDPELLHRRCSLSSDPSVQAEGLTLAMSFGPHLRSLREKIRRSASNRHAKSPFLQMSNPIKKSYQD